MPAPHPASRRGSALLIVLGLLSFLMISAVAFSISMRTEFAAAASYRRSVATRELLISAFTDARATVDYALRRQLNQASPAFDRDNPSTRTVEALAPFKYDNADRYGRLIASYNQNATDDDSIAYLLDDSVMRHIPPYIAASVYHTLELQNPLYGGSAQDHAVGGGNGYRIDWSASWKPVTALIPDDSDNQQDNTDYVPEAVIGRMAWAVVNLSDSLDINAIGSTSAYRGIGLTGNEFAFGTAATGSTAVDKADMYDLLQSETSTTTAAELPLFASNADLAQYAAQVSNSPLTLDNGEVFPYSWEDAVAQDGDGFFSPFSVYSFWPNAERIKEDGTRTTGNSSSGSSTAEVIPCNEVTESNVSQGATGVGAEVISAANARLGSSGDTGFNLVRLLADYIDRDSVPALFDSGATQDLYPNAAPTVERVPMVCEVTFSEEGWGNNGEIAGDLEKQTEEAFKDLYPNGTSETYDTAEDIPSNLGDQTITLEIKDVSQMIGMRAYFPGGAESEESFSVEPEGFVGIVAAGLAAEAEAIEFEKDAVANDLSSSGGTLDISGGGSEVFVGTGSASVALKGKGIDIKIKGDKIPVANPAKATPDQPQEIRLSFLVDFFFRVGVRSGSDYADLAPTDQGNGALRVKADYPTRASARFERDTMAKLDSQFFRITRPLTVTFSLQWKVDRKKDANGKQTFTAKAEFTDKPKAESPFDAEFAFSKNVKIAPATANQVSYLSSSPESATWFTVDPRYNWLSPTLGISDNASAYGTGLTVLSNFSSPHWLCCEGEEMTSGSTTPSSVQEDYAAKNADIVPFVWGLKIEDIRYGHNDSGQLLLPAEIGFLPVPFSTNEWHPGQRDYQRNTISGYYNSVARASFFRTLPAVDFKDGAMDYARYTPLTAMLKSFAGDNFPEEHRGIVHAFAGQDDYYTCQRLRQFAMLGIPSSITQAAKVTFDRLTAASSVSRVSPEMLTSDLKELDNETIQQARLEPPKYDTFIRDYLFYVPDGPRKGGDDSWASSQAPYKGAASGATPHRVQTADDIILQDNSPDATFVDKLKAYNEESTDKLGQNDMTTLLAVARECFGDRQQLFLYILRADSIAYNSGRDLSQHKTLATARAVALVWRDAYGELPDRVVYYQLLP